MSWKVWLIQGGVLGLCVAALYFTHAQLSERSIRFGEVQEAWRAVKDAGFHWTADRADGQVDNGFLVSKGPLAHHEVNALAKAGPLTSDWQQKVWFTTVEGLQGLPEDAGVRIWGRVVAFGDQNLLDEVEAALKSTRP